MRGKSQQLQIRVTAAEKQAIQEAAALARMDMSRWVLSRVLPPADGAFAQLVQAITDDPAARSYAFAELNDFLSRLEPDSFSRAVAKPPAAALELYAANYLAAMVETAANRNGVPPPAWTAAVPPLDEPVFGTPLLGLRLHLLIASPPSFRRRNIFVDSGIGDRV